MDLPIALPILLRLSAKITGTWQRLFEGGPRPFG